MKILMALTSHDKLGKTGFWLEEFAAPYFTFEDAGAEIELASPNGGQPPLDPKSNEPNFQTDLTHRFEADADAQARLAATVGLDSVKADNGECGDLRNPPHLEPPRSRRARTALHDGRPELPGSYGEISNGAASGKGGGPIRQRHPGRDRRAKKRKRIPPSMAPPRGQRNTRSALFRPTPLRQARRFLNRLGTRS